MVSESFVTIQKCVKRLSDALKIFLAVVDVTLKIRIRNQSESKVRCENVRMRQFPSRKGRMPLLSLRQSSEGMKLGWPNMSNSYRRWFGRADTATGDVRCNPEHEIVIHGYQN